MAKFIRIKNNLINLDKVVTIAQDYNEIWVYYVDGNPTVIEYDTEQEAQLVFEDIPHLIDSSHIPAFVREHQLNELKWKAQQAEAKAVIGAMDNSDWNELPF